MGAHEIDFDSSGNPVVPQYMEELHRRALLSDLHIRTQKVHAAFAEQETKDISQFYNNLRNVVDYALKELQKHHSGQIAQVQQARQWVVQYQLDVRKLWDRLREIQHFEDEELATFEQWKREDDRLRHARLSKSLQHYENELYSIDKTQLKISKKAKAICGYIAESLRKSYIILERINRSFEAKDFTYEEYLFIFNACKELIEEMNTQLHWLRTLESFELKNIALWGQQVKLGFLLQKEMRSTDVIV